MVKGWSDYAKLLGLPASSPKVQRALGELGVAVRLPEDSEGYGSADSQEHGIAVMVERSETLWKKPRHPAGTTTVSAVHLYAEGLEEHCEFAGELLNDV